MGCRGEASERRWCAEASLISECITGTSEMTLQPYPPPVLWFELWSRLWACWLGSFQVEYMGMCSRNAHRTVLQFLMGTRTRLESACRKKDSVSILHFSWSFSSDVLSLYFLLMWNLVMRSCFFLLKPNCLHFCYLCTPSEESYPLHLHALFSIILPPSQQPPWTHREGLFCYEES